MQETNWALEITKIIPATVIGLGVGYIAYMQWKTAHTKVIIDLFDKRLAIYEAVLEAVTLSNIDDGSGSQLREAHSKLFRARSDATFLFGDEIASIVTEIIKCVSLQRRNERRLNRDLPEDVRLRLADELEHAANRQDKLSRDFQTACLPFMQIIPKKIRSPVEWLREKNAKRLSFADEKQRPRE
ncbi:hypothetical protein [Brucella intermedia]|uniref:hypothetical protein n=1 Tax=Brucella intermedia TaxID=94625 RepID=UPI0007C84E5F|nr:hypothetical protein [Brucella intermedia]OAE43948.1 hypothetical protein A7J42_00735 [Brucella intermedia]